MSLSKQKEDAIHIATNAHNGQFRKGGLPYITHPLAVSQLAKLEVENYFPAQFDYWRAKVEIVGLLHDVVEDTPVTLEELTDTFDLDIVEGVKAMTEVEGDTYYDKVIRARHNSYARVVKIADLTHNLLDLDRNKYKHKYDKYELALHMLRDY
jgi:(p)ppGpp synthase/HD superfamily hydrolase